MQKKLNKSMLNEKKILYLPRICGVLLLILLK